VILDRVVTRTGRGIALTGMVLPLLLIGVSKFAAVEVEALKPVVGGAPWLAWMYTVFGPVNTARLMGVVEIVTALLLIASVWIPRAGVAGGAIAGGIFCVTLSLLASVPIWEAGSGPPWRRSRFSSDAAAEASASDGCHVAKAGKTAMQRRIAVRRFMCVIMVVSSVSPHRIDRSEVTGTMTTWSTVPGTHHPARDRVGVSPTDEHLPRRRFAGRDWVSPA
jgi:Protein of unknown function, DUF417